MHAFRKYVILTKEIRFRDWEAVSSIYIWSKNFSDSACEKGEAKMAAIDVQ
jgi:hypothetical protein